MIRNAIGLAAALGLILAGAMILRDTHSPASITIRWESGSEEDVAGFNLWRKDPDSPMGLINHKLNEGLIPAEGSPLSGASYDFIDETVDAGTAYTYQIEEVSPEGIGRRHPDTIEAVATDRAWQGIEGWIAILVGLGMAGLHINDRRKSPAPAPAGESL
jgi:hypothetical protein